MYLFSRTLLAVMHFNENAGREQQHTEAGEARYAINFPKWKKGGYSVKKVLAEPKYGEDCLQCKI